MFKCSFDEFVGEKVFSPSYSSAILAPLPFSSILKSLNLIGEFNAFTFIITSGIFGFNAYLKNLFIFN